MNHHPLCEQCERDGKSTPAELVDHIVELIDGGDSMAEDNLQALCRKCHAKKTRREEQKRRRWGG